MAPFDPNPQQLTPRQKAALFILSLDVQTAKLLMQQLSQEEVEALTVEITNLKGVSSTVADQVIEQFHEMIAAQEYVVQGGLDHAHRLLEGSLGMGRADEVLDKVRALTNVKGFGILKRADSQQLASFLQKEHPQTIALILSNLHPEQAARVLSEFPDELRNDVAYRTATIGKVSPALLTEVEEAVEDIARREITQSMSTPGGAKAVAALLNKSSNAVSRGMLDHIEQMDPTLSNEIKRLMFLFEDLVYVDDRGIQRILREVDKKELAMALKVVDDTLRDKIFKNMSERAQELLKEEIQYMGPVRLKEVEAAQARIVDIVKQLEESGEVMIAGRGGSEDIFV